MRVVTDSGEEVDGKPRVCRVVSGEDPVEGLLQRRIADAVDQLPHAHVLSQFLKDDEEQSR